MTPKESTFVVTCDASPGSTWVTNLAEQAGVDLSAICSAVGVSQLADLPLSLVPGVVKKLQSKLSVTA